MEAASPTANPRMAIPAALVGSRGCGSGRDGAAGAAAGGGGGGMGRAITWPPTAASDVHARPSQ